MRAVPEWADGFVMRLGSDRAAPARCVTRTPSASRGGSSCSRTAETDTQGAHHVGGESVEVAAQLLDRGEVAAQHLARLGWREPRLGVDVPHGAHERRGIEAGERADARRRGRVVGRRALAVQAKHGAEEHHHRAQARRDELRLPLAVRAGEQRALPKLEQLSHHLLLELEPQIAPATTVIPSNGGSPCSTRCRSRMSAYSIGKMSAERRHSSSVMRQRRRIARLAPRARHGRRARSTTTRRAAERVEQHEHVVVGAVRECGRRPPPSRRAPRTRARSP